MLQWQIALTPPVTKDPTPHSKSSGDVPWHYWAALVLVVLRLWIQPITSSFWLDETGTFLIVQGTFRQMLERSLHWVGQPAFFAAVVWPFAQLPGPREVVFRLPSLIGLSLATLFVYRIGRRLLGKEGAGAAMLIFAALSAYYASDARPYALGLMAASGAALSLLRWLDNGKLFDAICYAFLAALTVYFHFLFGVMFLVHGAYILLRLLESTGPKIGVLVFAWALSLVLLLPLAPSFLRVSSNRGTLRFLETPRLAGIVMESAPEFLYGFLIAGFLAVVFLCSGVRFSPPPVLRPEIWFLVLWTVAPPTILFLVSYATPTKVFLLRYFAVSLPGMALLVAWIIGSFQPASARTILTIVLALGAVFERGGRPRLPHSSENWRAGLAAVDSIVRVRPIPVLMRSGFIEATDPETFADPDKAELLLAPLSAYPISTKAIPLPYRSDDWAIDYLNSITEKVLLQSDEFLLVSSSGEDHYRTWLRGRLYATPYDVSEAGHFGTVSVHRFKRR